MSVAVFRAFVALPNSIHEEEHRFVQARVAQCYGRKVKQSELVTFHDVGHLLSASIASGKFIAYSVRFDRHLSPSARPSPYTWRDRMSVLSDSSV